MAGRHLRLRRIRHGWIRGCAQAVLRRGQVRRAEGLGHPWTGTPCGSRLLGRWLWDRILREISVGIRDSVATVLDDLCGSLPDHTDAGSPRLANLCDGRPDARDDVIDHLTGADLDHRLAERLGQLPYDLGVVIDRIENAINGPGDVV